MEYIELTVHTSTEGSELIADILWDYTDLGVAISDVNDIIQLSQMKRKMWDYMEDGLMDSKEVLVKGYFPVEEFSGISKTIYQDIMQLKRDCTFNLGSLELVTRTVDGDAWLNVWKEHFKPIKLGGIVICPEWIEYTPTAEEKVVKIDANMAFGTGEHETTSMCIELLQDYVTPKSTVIDVGCGSGILGISASKLGAGKVVMTDIDGQAVEASISNSKLNGVTADIYEKNLLDDTAIKGDVIVANIMAEILVDFADKIGGNLLEKGVIILSGILLEKLEMVKTAYEKAGFVQEKLVQKGEWCAISFKRDNL